MEGELIKLVKKVRLEAELMGNIPLRHEAEEVRKQLFALEKVLDEAAKDIASCFREKSSREEALGAAWNMVYFANSYEVMYFDLLDKFKKWFGVVAEKVGSETK